MAIGNFYNFECRSFKLDKLDCKLDKIQEYFSKDNLENPKGFSDIRF